MADAEKDGGASYSTCKWLTKDHMEEVLEILSPLVAERILLHDLARGFAQPQPTKKEKKDDARTREAVVLEGNAIRVACVFRPSPWLGYRYFLPTVPTVM